MLTLTDWPQQVPPPPRYESGITAQRPGGCLQSWTYLCGLIKPPLRASSPHPHNGDHDSLDSLLSGHASTKAGLQYKLCAQELSHAKRGAGSCLRALVHAKSLHL